MASRIWNLKTARKPPFPFTRFDGDTILSMTMHRTLPLAAALVLAALFPAAPAAAQARDVPIPHDVGQSVSPVFEGWFPNDDGTYTLSFGYFNRNYEATLDIPIGPDNRFEPGPADRGQPTHLMPRRQTGIFTVVVPADFDNQTLTWSLTSAGETYAVPGHIRPEWQIDALHEITSDNRPPVVVFPGGASGQGPTGARQSLEASVGQPLTLDVTATDDGVMKRPTGQPPMLGLAWSKYRGPGEVTFAEPSPEVGGDDRATTTVSFAAPGDYILRLLAWDDSGGPGAIMALGFQCCWTNAYVDVRVE